MTDEKIECRVPCPKFQIGAQVWTWIDPYNTSLGKKLGVVIDRFARKKKRYGADLVLGPYPELYEVLFLDDSVRTFLPHGINRMVEAMFDEHTKVSDLCSCSSCNSFGKRNRKYEREVEKIKIAWDHIKHKESVDAMFFWIIGCTESFAQTFQENPNRWVDMCRTDYLAHIDAAVDVYFDSIG